MKITYALLSTCIIANAHAKVFFTTGSHGHQISSSIYDGYSSIGMVKNRNYTIGYFDDSSYVSIDVGSNNITNTLIDITKITTGTAKSNNYFRLVSKFPLIDASYAYASAPVVSYYDSTIYNTYSSKFNVVLYQNKLTSERTHLANPLSVTYYDRTLLYNYRIYNMGEYGGELLYMSPKLIHTKVLGLKLSIIDIIFNDIPEKNNYMYGKVSFNVFHGYTPSVINSMDNGIKDNKSFTAVTEFNMLFNFNLYVMGMMGGFYIDITSHMMGQYFSDRFLVTDLINNKYSVKISPQEISTYTAGFGIAF